MKKSYTSLEAVLHNLLVLHFDSLEFNVANTNCKISYFPQGFDFQPELTSYILAGQDEVKLEFSSMLPLSLHEDMRNISNFTSLPIELQQALFEYIFEKNLRTFSSKINLPLSFLTSPNSNEESYPFVFQVTIGSEFLFMRLWLTENIASFLMPILKNLPAKKRSLKYTNFNCSFLVGSMDLEIDAVKTLAVDDVLLPNNLTHIGQEKHVFLKIFATENPNNFEYNYLCSLNGLQLTLIEKNNVKENNMSNEENINNVENAEQASADSANTVETVAEEAKENIGMSQAELKNVPLNLSFELERRSMTLAEVEELHVGTNIMLSCDPLSPVTINISDTAYAKARLVDIDGGYGLQITEILMKQD